MRKLVLGMFLGGLMAALPGAAMAQDGGPYGDPYDPYARQTGAWGGGSNNIVLYLGAKSLDSGDWAPVDEHTEAGVGVDFQPAGLPFGFDVRLLASESDTTFLGDTMTTSELDFGLRKTWGQSGYSNMHPYLAGGLAAISGEFLGISDSAGGIWVAFGIYWVLSASPGAPGLAIGGELMSSAAYADFGTGTDANIGGGHFNFTIGYHF